MQCKHPGARFKARSAGLGLRRGAVLAVLWLCTHSIPALGADILNQQYVHTDWTLRDGFNFFPIQALAQTADGYLWIGTPTGLWRFDGAQFVEWKARPGQPDLPDKDVRSLFAAQSGGLWMGTSARISKLENGRLTNHVSWNASTHSGVRALLEDRSHRLWAGTSGRNGGSLMLVRPSGVSAYGAIDGLPDSGINAIFEDHDGNIWVGTRGGLYRWRAPLESFLTNPATEVYSIAEDERHQLVIACNATSRLMHFSDGKLEPFGGLPESMSARVLMTGRDKTIWIGTFSEGLAYIRNKQAHYITRKDGLSGSAVQALLEDHDGNIWVGTRSGLDRFRPANFALLSEDDGLSQDLVTAVCQSRNGSVWVGTATGGLNRVTGDTIVTKGVADGLPSDSVLSLYEDAGGRLWVGTMKGLAVQAGERFVPLQQAVDSGLDHITVITGDQEGRIWLADAIKGIYTIKEGIVQPLQAAGLPRSNDVYALLADSQDRLWIGYYQGVLALVSGGAAKMYVAHRDFAPGAVLALNEDATGTIWVGSSGGLSRYRGGRWTVWSVEKGLLPTGVLQIIQDGHDDLWLTTEKGVLKADASELNKQRDGAPRPLHLVSYSTSLGSLPHVVQTRPRGCTSRDGRLWFASDEGVLVLDPAHVRPDVAPHLIIEQLTIDGQPANTDVSSDSLAFRGQELQFNYAVTNLIPQDRVQFRYRLQGFDKHWVDSGGIRHARYVNLSPGNYKFSVEASNAYGIGNSANAALAFRLLPAFYQTTLFRVLCASVVCIGLFGLYRLRIDQIVRQHNAATQERLAERTRIARELHDTLLQSVVGVSLQLDALSNTLQRGSNPHEKEIRHIRRQVDDALLEARHAVWALRAPEVRDAKLAAAIEFTGLELAAAHDMHFSMYVSEDRYDLPSNIKEHLLRIVQEAIANAVFHSHGRQIRVELIYLPDELTLRVRDDGSGMEQSLIETGRPGHFGLRGIRERAERISADFSILSSSAGTQISLTLPVSREMRAGNIHRVFSRIFGRFLEIAQAPRAR